MKALLKNIQNHLFSILIIVEIVFILTVCFSQHITISFDDEPLYQYNNWVQNDSNGKENNITLPSKLTATEDRTVIIHNILPNYIVESPRLIIKTSHQHVKAYIDNKLIYTSELYTKSSLIDIPYKTFWNIITLPPDSSGKLITLEFTSDYEDYVGELGEIIIGTKSALLLHMYKTSGIGLLISIIIMFWGGALLTLYIALKYFIHTYKWVLHLGRFCFISSLWMILESDMIQFFIDNQSIITALTYITLMTLPIPLLQYISAISTFRHKTLTKNLCILYGGYVIIMMTLQIFNIFDFHETITVLHVFIFGIFSIVFITMVKELLIHKVNDLRYITFGSGILLIFGLIELLLYRTSIMETGFALLIGILLFVITLTWGTIKKVISVIRLSESAKHYQYLATWDTLTKCKNRTAYTNDIPKIAKRADTVAIVADINNLKYINDNFGHDIGDEAIKKCAKCILEIFGEYGDYYRIGGDEFIWLGEGMKLDKITSMANNFFSLCKKENDKCTFPFEVSIGYAFYDGTMDHDLYDTVRRADKFMYNRKEKMK